MGIVSYCPAGHRVKVKDHLAGKNGICPSCGAKFRIPFASVAAPPRAEAGPGAAVLPVAVVVSLDPMIAANLPPVLPLAPTSPVPRSRPQAVAPPAVEPDEQDVEFLPDEVLEPAAVPAAIAEAPGASWAVAVPGGEASQPMSGEALHAWLLAGDATGSELVWRSDWTEWRAVRQVFPEHVPPSPGGGFPSW